MEATKGYFGITMYLGGTYVMRMQNTNEKYQINVKKLKLWSTPYETKTNLYSRARLRTTKHLNYVDGVRKPF